VGFSVLLALDHGKRYDLEVWSKMILMALALVYGGAVAYSRVFLGVHSYDQIIFGSALGIWLALTLHYIFRRDTLQHLDRVLNLTDKDYSKYTLNGLALLGLTLATLIANYYLFDGKIDEAWTSRIE